jgi:carboxylesterase
MRPLGEGLAARGFPVHAVRLAGHGTVVEDLTRTRWEEWVASVEEGLRVLREHVPRVAVAGMSMGGLLTLRLAATHPAEVAAVVACGTPVRLADPRLRMVPVILRTPWLRRRWELIPKENGGPDVVDPVARAASPSYRAVPLAGVGQLLRLQARVRRVLREVRQPALVLHGRQDRSVPLGNVVLLRRSLGSQTIETHILERSGHVITVDYDREEVVRLTADFLTRVEAGAVR